MLGLDSLNLRGQELLELGLNYRSSSPINTLRIDIPKPLGLKNRVSIEEGMHPAFTK
jgi:hypothetical protein